MKNTYVDQSERPYFCYSYASAQHFLNLVQATIFRIRLYIRWQLDFHACLQAGSRPYKLGHRNIKAHSQAMRISRSEKRETGTFYRSPRHGKVSHQTTQKWNTGCSDDASVFVQQIHSTPHILKAPTSFYMRAKR